MQVAMLLSMLGNEHAAYWGSRYVKELALVRTAMNSGSADPMEGLFVWFGKMAMLRACQTMSSNELALQPESSVVLDLGCGNGFMCEVLHAMGFKKVIGVDYSPHAIRLAQVRVRVSVNICVSVMIYVGISVFLRAHARVCVCV